MAITLEAIRAAGGIVHSDGNIFFRDISMLQGLAGAAPAAVAPQGEYPPLPAAAWEARRARIVLQENAYTAAQMHSYFDLGRQPATAAPALEAPAAPGRQVLTDAQITHLQETRVGEPSPSRPIDASDWTNFARAIEAAALAAAPQAPAGVQAEPVAWMYQRHGGNGGALFKPAGQEADDLRVGRPNIMAPCPNHYGWTALYAAPAPQAPAAPRVVFADWEMEDRDPVAMLDKIYAVYQRSMGKPAPDAEMAEVVELTKDMLLAWWGEHREDIRAAMVAAQAQAAGAAPVGDLEGWAIDKSTGTDILVYKGCSVIEDEHAHRLLALLSAAPAAPAVDAPALGEWVATLEVDSEGGLDYETVPPCTLPPGCYRLYRAAQAKEGGA